VDNDLNGVMLCRDDADEFAVTGFEIMEFKDAVERTHERVTMAQEEYRLGDLLSGGALIISAQHVGDDEKGN
jgi:hypothetical protein